MAQLTGYEEVNFLMSETPIKVLILGGGTAGWMAANYMAHKWAAKNIQISLLESPEIGIVGVGEGSTPSLKNFFDDVEIEESEWMPECNATYKVSIRFDHWSTTPGFEQYNHPFPSEVDVTCSPKFAQNCRARRFNYDVDVHPDNFFLQAHLGNHQLSPLANYNFPFQSAYGYHFDSGLLGQFLAKKAVMRGVSHLQGKVEEVLLNEQGEINQLRLDSGDLIEGDFFIDCSGFRSVLLQQALKVNFKSFKSNLFNDSAVVLPTVAKAPLESITISTAMKNGWAWDIPLTNRTGNGYVYSSQFCNADQAETELRKKLGLLESDVEARHLAMKVGQVEKHWFKNCLAIGLSQGFIEPLEATALHIVQVTILEFMLNFEEGNFTAKNRDKFNQIVSGRFEGVRDYIVAHYRLNTRTDSDYWLANANNQNLSESLIRILNSWTGGIQNDLDKEILQQKIAHYFPVDSWRILLAGYGFFPTNEALKSAADIPQNIDMQKHADFLKRCASNYQSQNAAIGAHRAPITQE